MTSRNNRGVALALLVTGLAAAPVATAVTQDKIYEFPAADACQLSVPTTDTKVRPKASGYRNEGTTNQFVICGMGGYEKGTVLYMVLLYASMDGAQHDMSCTGVTGMTGIESGPAYSTKTVTVAASGYSFATWGAEDFGGVEGNLIDPGLNLSVTCTLPPNVALQGFESEQFVDVGN
ncbi:MAG: hypothetical protein QM719_07415 [Thermomonas sp.]